MYIIVRSDLKPISYQLPQACHAVCSFIFEHMDLAKQWHEQSDYLVILNVNNEIEILNLLNKANELNIKNSVYREPDLNNEITAITLEPGINSKKLCQKLKLAMIDIN